MLKIKYIRDFEEGEPMLVISGEKEDYMLASKCLKDKEHAYFDDPTFAEYYDSPFITRDRLYITKEECNRLSDTFSHFATHVWHACHNYFETKALGGEEIEVHISYHEYPDRIFKDWS